MRTPFWLYLILMLVVTACAMPATSSTPSPAGTTSTPRPDAMTPTAGGELNVTFKRSGGIAGVNEVFALNSDGTIIARGQTKQVEGGRAAASELAQKIAATGIYQVPPDRYMPLNRCCDRFTYELTLVKDGRTYTYMTMDSTENAPPALLQTLALVHQYIVSAR